MTKAELYKKACMLPLLPGVYIIRDKTDTIIYIGKAKRLKIRVSQYFREGVPHDAKVTQMINHAFTFDVIVCQSEFEALVLEASQIKAHTPKYNILLKDDKGYSYVKITRGPWPRVSAALQKDDDDADYIGPFTSSFAVREMVEMAQDCFLLPRCSKEFPRDFGKGRPCLNAHIGKCMAVCSGKITCEAYNDAVQGALRMIRYGKKDIVKQLREKMEAASDRLDFETAALLRDQIQAIERVAAGQKVVMDADTEMDIIALAGTTRAVCAAVLRYRDGRLTDKREFMFHDTTDIDAVREEFLPQYYLDGETIPKTIAVDTLPPDAEALIQKAIPALIRTMALSNPSGKQNSFAGNVLPSAILIECKEEKVPVSMVNAFVNPVKPNEKNGYDLVRGSILRLAEQVESVQNSYGLTVDKRLWFCQDIYDIQPQCDTMVCASLPELLEQVADTLQ